MLKKTSAVPRAPVTPVKIGPAEVIDLCEGSEPDVANEDNAYASEWGGDMDEDEINATSPRWEEEMKAEEEASDADDAKAGPGPSLQKAERVRLAHGSPVTPPKTTKALTKEKGKGKAAVTK